MLNKNFSGNSALKVVIPARYGSSRLPGKPLINLNGLPMIVRVSEAVNKALSSTEIVVAIDDPRIAEVLKKYNIPFVMTSADHQSGTDRVSEVARILNWQDDDIIINVQGDEPLIPGDLIREFSNFCINKDNFCMGTISVPVESVSQLHDINIVKVIVNANSNAIAFSRSVIPYNRDGDLSTADLAGYLRHIGIYAYRNSILQKITHSKPCLIEEREKLEQLRALWLGIPIHIYLGSEAPPAGVDTADDIERVCSILNELK
ncbi:MULTISPECIES: 3-deoxy-manno-octulosonate cytidylyltransferase [Enterobacteriaceae]|uniref:3-deoxy-manno-octulosonate cytidylyltransferase n=1 Tax=Enterobacteriaceae TaxID=543 RepID=UPI0008FC5F0D|nr:3-deoxy-manno-octulosonate cytidylyltransferase [Entomohabitans teleogrylli]EHQ8971742.1 3-deoxy-manno-octulosonate cytidylyltransferase [Escherichia coli]